MYEKNESKSIAIIFYFLQSIYFKNNFFTFGKI